MLLHVAEFPFFSPVEQYPIVFVCVHIFCIYSSVKGTLKLVVVNKRGTAGIFLVLFLFPLDIYPEVKFMDHTLVLFLIFLDSLY